MALAKPVAALGMFQVVRVRRTYEEIAEQISQLIKSNQLRAGERLPGERDLASQFGVSRPSLREALIALEATGLIEVRPGEGAFVRMPPEQIAPGSWTSDYAQEPSWMEQLDACILIEPEVAALAAKSSSKQLVDALADALAVLRKNEPESEAAYQGRYKFHTELGNHCGNTFLSAAVKQLWTLRSGKMWRSIRKRHFPAELDQQMLDCRTAILKAMRDKNARQARLSMIALMKLAKKGTEL